MKTFSITTLGCKVNQYESQQIRELLEQSGLRQVESELKADLVIVHSCCVTQNASAKSRQHLHKARRQNPGAVVVLSGCLPATQTDELENHDERVHLIRRRDTLATRLGLIINNEFTRSAPKSLEGGPSTHIRPKNRDKIKHKKDLRAAEKLPELTCFKGHTRAFLKVQDGCDGCCTYCIVPKTRPIVQSRPIERVLGEARALVEAGHKEIVVTGIFLGAYGQQSVRRRNWPDGQNDRLAELLDRMAGIAGLSRIRLSSLGPADVTERLLATLGKNSNIMPHLHLSLQSGSDAVLRRMCRQYRANDFREKLALVRSSLDRPAITTDLIVGFPGETEADFEQTVELAEEAGFAKMHVFAFSPRKGTVAAGMDGHVDPRVIKERSRVLHDLNLKLGREFRRQFIGETAEILLERTNGRTRGRSERYFMVHLAETGVKPRQNELVKVRLLEDTEEGMSAQICAQAPLEARIG